MMIHRVEILLALLGFIGFALAFYIFQKKQAARPLFCPLRSNCTTVVTSRYATFLGMPIELLGMGYYGLTVLLHSLVAAGVIVVSGHISFMFFMLSFGAFLFSLYLVSIQAFALRQWCTWCLTSAIISTTIFFGTIMYIPETFQTLFSSYKPIIVILHALAAGVGVGATTITDIFFFKFLKDYKISEEELNTMHTLSQVIWATLGALIFTGLALYLSNSEVLNHSSKFLLKVVIVGILTVNGVVLNLIVSPRMTRISFGGQAGNGIEGLRHLRRLSFACGAISLSSWYLVFILGSLRSIALPFDTLLSIYLGFLCVAVLGSQVFEYLFTRKLE